MTNYKGHEMTVDRREKNAGRYELHLVVDGEDVTTATALERDGLRWSEDQTWVEHLYRHGRAYIDGMEAAAAEGER